MAVLQQSIIQCENHWICLSSWGIWRGAWFWIWCGIRRLNAKNAVTADFLFGAQGRVDI